MSNLIGNIIAKGKENIATKKILDKEITESIIKKAILADPAYERKFIACCATPAIGIAWAKADVDSFKKYGNWNMTEPEIIAGRNAMWFMIKKDPEYLDKLKEG